MRWGWAGGRHQRRRSSGGLSQQNSVRRRNGRPLAGKSYYPAEIATNVLEERADETFTARDGAPAVSGRHKSDAEIYVHRPRNVGRGGDCHSTAARRPQDAMNNCPPRNVSVRDTGGPGGGAAPAAAK